jgi:hypothetical protein
MSIFFGYAFSLSIAFALLIPSVRAQQGQSTSSSSSSVPHGRKSPPAAEPRLDSGSISQGVYRNPTFGFTCKIPPGWVLRTEEMNAGQQAGDAAGPVAKSAAKPGQVLLAAFSRPPQAHGEDVNSSILIAAESAAAYPGLREAAQYLGPVSEIAKAQGFEVVSEPYEFAVGAKTMVREDFQRDVAQRVMLQSTLVMLARDYAVSFTFIAGTEDEVEELIANLAFAHPPAKH